jgi:hypothetical protein
MLLLSGWWVRGWRTAISYQLSAISFQHAGFVPDDLEKVPRVESHPSKDVSQAAKQEQSREVKPSSWLLMPNAESQGLEAGS